MGGIRLTQDEVKKYIENLNGEYLGEEIIKNRRIINIKCNVCGNVWKSTLSNIKIGKWCLKCYKTEHNVNRQKVIDLLKEKGYELKIDGKLGLKTRFKVYCPIHEVEWESCYFNFKYGDNGSCSLCAKNYPSINIIRDYIFKNNGILLKRVAERGKKPYLLVKCNIHNHEFKTGWGKIQRGVWCSKCDDANRTVSYEEIKKLVEEKDGYLLSTDCATATGLFNIRCNKDNCEWETSWSRIQSGCWYPRCSACEPYTIEKVREIIKEKGGELLSDNIANVKQKVSIKCDCGNIFESVLYHIINRGVWCQICDSSHSKQKDLYNILKEIFPSTNIQYNYYGFGWLKDVNRLELDIWIPELKLAIEYDGEQHFKPIKFASTMTDEQAMLALSITQKHDKLKNKLISEHPDEVKYFVRFNYLEDITKENILIKLKNSGLSI